MEAPVNFYSFLFLVLFIPGIAFAALMFVIRSLTDRIEDDL